MKRIEELQFRTFNFGGVHEPIQGLALAAEINEGQIQHGVWESGPGELDLKFAWSETVFVLEGRAEIENVVTGERQTLLPGSLMTFEQGSHWLWRIPWKLKKVFTIIALE